MQFIHYELAHYRSGDTYDPIPFERFNFLKSYFLIVEEIAEKNKKAFESYSSSEEDFFRTRTWPLLSEQFEANANSDMVINILRGFALFKYFEDQKFYEEYVETFLEKNGKKNSWQYLKNIMDLLQINWSDQSYGPIRPFFLKSADKESFLENLTVDIHEYQKKFLGNKINFNGIKKAPLLKTKENFYLVLNWNYLTNKSYEGLVFDFYSHSGITTLFKSFLDFKNHISYNVTEKYIFRKLLIYIFQKKYTALNFFDDDQKNMPDAYYRKGKYIYLFEIKDAYFPASAIGSYSYEKIKSAIDQKFNSSSKGTGQILKQLERLKENPFEDISYRDLKIKTKNLVIYPVMVYTDSNFGMMGVNKYLNETFKTKVNFRSLEESFSQIKDLSFISLSFFMENIVKLREKELRYYLDGYHSYVKAQEKKHLKNSDMSSMFAANHNLEHYFYEKIDLKAKVKKTYLEKIFEVLELPKIIS